MLPSRVLPECPPTMRSSFSTSLERPQPRLGFPNSVKHIDIHSVQIPRELNFSLYPQVQAIQKSLQVSISKTHSNTKHCYPCPWPSGSPQQFTNSLSMSILVTLKSILVVQLLSHIQFFVNPWTAAQQAPLSFTISWSLLKLMSIESVIPSNHLSPPSPALNLSQHQSFPISRLFASGGQSIGTSASASVLPVNIQGWFPLGLTSLISLLSNGLSRVFFSTIHP